MSRIIHHQSIISKLANENQVVVKRFYFKSGGNTFVNSNLKFRKDQNIAQAPILTVASYHKYLAQLALNSSK
jgi:hypothetical protein